MPFRGKMDSQMLGRNSKALIYVAWVEKLNPLFLFARPCQKKKKEEKIIKKKGAGVLVTRADEAN